jgi:hypothetical protein
MSMLVNRTILDGQKRVTAEATQMLECYNTEIDQLRDDILSTLSVEIEHPRERVCIFSQRKF